jgi:serine/threonine protein kinase
MVDGYVPFEMKKDICESQLVLDAFSDKVRNLIHCMLLKDPDHRYTLQDVSDALE